MNKTLLTITGALLFAGIAHAAPLPAPAPINDRIAELCAVSNTDLEGQRLARTCRAEVRAKLEAKALAAKAEPRPVRTASADPVRPR